MSSPDLRRRPVCTKPLPKHGAILQDSRRLTPPPGYAASNDYEFLNTSQWRKRTYCRVLVIYKNTNWVSEYTEHQFRRLFTW